MDRRRFLQGLLAGGLACTPGPRLLRAAAALGERQASGARWLDGWESVRQERFGPTRARIEGRWPAELAGTLYRNGPALFERAGLRCHHWFDGDGMVHTWRCSAAGVEHRARMVGTAKYRREEGAGRFLLPASGTTIANAVPIRNNDDLNTANTAIIRHAGRVFALWEAGSAFEIDPDELATLGPVTWREDLAAAPFSAHPLVDADGSLWNFGSLDLLGATGLLIWHIGTDGRLQRAATVSSARPGYLHAFAMTRRHLVFVLTPCRMSGDEGRAFFERLEFTPNQPCEVVLVDKDRLDAPRRFEVGFAALYHFADAWESADEVCVRGVRHVDLEAMRSPMAGASAGRDEVRPASRPAELATLRLDLRRGTARWEGSETRNLEFPVFDPRHDPSRPAPLFAPVRRGARPSPWFNAIACIEGGRETVHCYGEDILAEEHRFVPRPGGGPGQGWLLGTVLDWKRGRSGLAVLDAQRIADGPLALAWLPYRFPLGFHGWFASAGTP